MRILLIATIIAAAIAPCYSKDCSACKCTSYPVSSDCTSCCPAAKGKVNFASPGEIGVDVGGASQKFIVSDDTVINGELKKGEFATVIYNKQTRVAGSIEVTSKKEKKDKTDKKD